MITMSAILTRDVVSVSSGRPATTFANARPGASFTSRICSVAVAVSSTPEPRVGSSTVMSTVNGCWVSKSSACPPRMNSSVPRSSKKNRFGPTSSRFSRPNASSWITMSATFARVPRKGVSGMPEFTETTSMVGASLMSVIWKVRSTESSGVAPTLVSSTETVTEKLESVSKSRMVPALRNNSVPKRVNRSALGPASESVSEPKASSLMTKSANLISEAVSVFSASSVTTLAASSEGGSLTSVTVSLNSARSSRPGPSVGSSTSMKTSSSNSLSKSSSAPAFKNNSNPSSSKSPLSAPCSDKVFVPFPSSVSTTSASLIRLETSVSSANSSTTFAKDKLGGSFGT